MNKKEIAGSYPVAIPYPCSCLASKAPQRPWSLSNNDHGRTVHHASLLWKIFVRPQASHTTLLTIQLLQVSQHVFGSPHVFMLSLKIIGHGCKNIALHLIVFIHSLLKYGLLIWRWMSWQHRHFLVEDIVQLLEIENNSQILEPVLVIGSDQPIGVKDSD